MASTVILIERPALTKHETDLIAMWAGGNDTVSIIRKVISDEIAALICENVNLTLETTEHPNEKLSIEANNQQVNKLRNFLEVLDELRAHKYTKKTTINTQSL